MTSSHSTAHQHYVSTEHQEHITFQEVETQIMFTFILKLADGVVMRIMKRLFKLVPFDLKLE
jgi:hypothetical protein